MGEGDGDDPLCLGFEHVTVSIRPVLQLARLTDGYHSFEPGFTLKQERSIRCDGLGNTRDS